MLKKVQDKLPNSKKLMFLIAGVVNTLFGYAVYAILIFLGFSSSVALLVSTISGVVFNYNSHGSLVFRAGGGRFVFARYIISYVLIYLANVVIVDLISLKFMTGLYIAQLLYMPIGVCLSWLLINYWVYQNE